MTLRLLAIFAAVLFAGSGAAADPADDVQDIVILADNRPLLVRLHLRIDGKPFRTAHRETWDDAVAHLFKYLDANSDGKLSEAEASRMPPPVNLSPGASVRPTNVAFNFRVVDENGDGQITLPELAGFYREFGLPPLQLHIPPRRINGLGRADDILFEKIDTDRDGMLSKEELAAAASVLAKLDRDGDELLTPQELNGMDVPVAPPPAVTRPAAVRLLIPSPVLLASATDDGRANLAAALLAKYGEAGPGAQGRKLRREQLGLTADAFARLDRNKDGTLDVSELQLFAERPADMELVVRTGKLDGQKPLELVGSAGEKGENAWTARLTADGMLALNSGTTLFELRVNDGGPIQAAGARRRVLDQFHAAMAEGKQSLTRKESIVHSFYPNLFPLLDRNGDDTLTEAEFTAFLDAVQDRQARAVANTAALLVSERGGGLFDLLDQNRDGQLSARELRAAPSLLARLGREREGKLSRQDLIANHQTAIGLGRASFGHVSETFSPKELPTLSLAWGRPSLIWFYKMDRNGDGDVSRREFLGPPETFTKIDTDGDGLISLEEALRADALFRK